MVKSFAQREHGKEEIQPDAVISEQNSIAFVLDRMT